MKYNERLHHARKVVRGITQEKLSDLSNVGQGSISKIERGDQNDCYSIHDIELSKALSISPFWLRYGDEPMELTSAGAASFSLSPNPPILLDDDITAWCLEKTENLIKDLDLKTTTVSYKDRAFIFISLYKLVNEENSVMSLPTKLVGRLINTRELVH